MVAVERGGSWSGPWVAVFLDGPMCEQRHVFMVGPMPERLYGFESPTRRGWVIVGIGLAPDPPYPGQAVYRLRGIRQDDEPDGELTAEYALEARYVGGDWQGGRREGV